MYFWLFLIQNLFTVTFSHSFLLYMYNWKKIRHINFFYIPLGLEYPAFNWLPSGYNSPIFLRNLTSKVLSKLYTRGYKRLYLTTVKVSPNLLRFFTLSTRHIFRLLFETSSTCLQMIFILHELKWHRDELESIKLIQTLFEFSQYCSGKVLSL